MDSQIERVKRFLDNETFKIRKPRSKKQGHLKRLRFYNNKNTQNTEMTKDNTIYFEMIGCYCLILLKSAFRTFSAFAQMPALFL